MGTAPDERQYPAMPDPRRTVQRSIRLAEFNGIPRGQAVAIIKTVTALLWGMADERYPELTVWIAQLEDAAAQFGADLNPSGTEHTGDDHGDGSGCRAGSPGQHQAG